MFIRVLYHCVFNAYEQEYVAWIPFSSWVPALKVVRLKLFQACQG